MVELLVLLFLEALRPRGDLPAFPDMSQVRFQYCLTCLLPLLVANSLSEFQHVVLGVDGGTTQSRGIAQLSWCLVPEGRAWFRLRHLQFQAFRGLAGGA